MNAKIQTLNENNLDILNFKENNQVCNSKF